MAAPPLPSFQGRGRAWSASFFLMSESEISPKPGATYKFVVRTAEEAVQTIRERLGENAKVLSVRQVGGQGLAGLFSKPKLEVIAQVAELGADIGRNGLGVSSEPAVPANFAESKTSSTASPVGASERQLSSSVTQTLSRATPGRDTTTRLPDLLRRSGFSETTLSRLQGTPAFATDNELPLHRALVEVGQHLRRQGAARRPRPLPARTAFLGTPGVGRTTALCKWLAREVFTHNRVGRVIKAEFDRPNSTEGLAVFCEALGLSLEYYAPDNSDSVPTTLGGPAGEFLYADLPGLALRASENRDIVKFLDREKFAGRVLVLNALYDASMMRRAYAVGSDLGATHVVFTHLDELEHWGRLWDFLLEGELTPLFLATGPSLTGDCEEDPLEAVMRKTLPGA